MTDKLTRDEALYLLAIFAAEYSKLLPGDMIDGALKSARSKLDQFTYAVPPDIRTALDHDGKPEHANAVADAKDGRIEAMREAGDLRLQLTACQQALIREGMERDAAIAKVRELERQLEIMSDIGKHFDSGELMLKTTAIGMPDHRSQAVLDAALDAHDPTGGVGVREQDGEAGRRRPRPARCGWDA